MIRPCDDNGDNEALRWRDAVPNPRGSEEFCAIPRVTIKAVLSQIKSSSMARIPGECFSAGEEKAVGRNDRLSLLDKKAKPPLRHTDRTEQAHIGRYSTLHTNFPRQDRNYKHHERDPANCEASPLPAGPALCRGWAFRRCPLVLWLVSIFFLG